MYLLRKRNIPLFLLLLLACSCSKDETSYLSELCVVKERGDQKLYLLSDAGVVFIPSTSLDSKDYSEGERFRVTYIRMQYNNSSAKDVLIDVKDMLPVKVLDVVPNSSIYANLKDPVWMMNRPWAGGGYLNFEFSYGYDFTFKIKHQIQLLQDSVVVRDSKKNIFLTFGHDANGDMSNRKVVALASFPLTSISGVNDADSLIVNVLEGKEHHFYKLSLTKNDLKNEGYK